MNNFSSDFNILGIEADCNVEATNGESGRVLDIDISAYKTTSLNFYIYLDLTLTMI